MVLRIVLRLCLEASALSIRMCLKPAESQVSPGSVRMRLRQHRRFVMDYTFYRMWAGVCKVLDSPWS